MSEAAKGIVCCGCACFWLIFFIVLLSISMKTIGQGEYAFVFSHYQQTIIGEPITEAGVKWVGPLNSVVRYPSVYQMVYFDNFDGYAAKEHEVVRPPVHSRTRDGLQVFVKVSFQWELKPSHLEGIYSILGGAEDLIEGSRVEEKPSFADNLVRFARGSLTNVCSWYTASQFFANQTLVEQRMQEELMRTFNKPEKGLVIGITGLQLRSVDLPDEYEKSIEETQKEQQDMQTAEAEKDTQDMKAQKDFMEASKEQEVLWQDAAANISAVEQENLAWVDQYMNFQKKQADAYARILATLSSSAEPYEALFALIRQKALTEHRSDKLTLTS